MKDKSLEKYNRETYTMAENIYKAYKDMKKAVNDIQSIKYEIDDPYLNSEEFKQGVIVGVKLMSAIFMDL